MSHVTIAGRSLSTPAVMGVINVSPNSFFNPAKDLSDVLTRAEKMVADGVDIIDIGGEATSPQVHIERDQPSVQEEIERVIPAIEKIRQHRDVLISIDSSKPEVMKAAVSAGANLLNDQRALTEEGALAMAARLQVPVCLMHFFNQRVPGSSTCEAMLDHIKSDLTEQVDRCIDAGILRHHLIIDPGFGQGNYGKNKEENFYLLAQLSRFKDLGLPILIGWSRKSMIGDVLNVPPSERLHGSISAAVIAAMLGASIIRVHDVKETVEAIKIFQATAGYLGE